MVKYKSDIILEEDLKVQTDKFWDENYNIVEVVKIIMISTGLEWTGCSWESQINAYNLALKELELKYKEYCINNNK